MQVRNHYQFNNKFECQQRYFDMGANLTQSSFKGIYNNNIQYHENDIQEVFQRAHKAGVDKMIIKSRSYEQMEECLKMTKLNNNYYTIAGIHPVRTFRKIFSEHSLEDHKMKLKQIISQAKDKCLAIGECGLDYSKKQYSTKARKDEQKELFDLHFQLAQRYRLPMMFVQKNAEKDFINMVEENRNKFEKGVLLNFQGPVELVDKLVNQDLYFGITAYSGKNNKQLEILKQIPLERMILESNAPYCSISEIYPGSKYVKTSVDKFSRYNFKNGSQVLGRNEPCNLVRLTEMIAGVKGLNVNEVAQQIYNNSVNFFELSKHKSRHLKTIVKA